MTKTRFAYALAGSFMAAMGATSNAEARGCNIRTTGQASYYGPGLQGNDTASGERFNMHGKENTAAHRSLPFNSLVRVTDLKTGKKITVRINDRGPYVGGRILDFQMATAQRVGLTRQRGVTRVRLDVLRCGG